MFSGYHIFLMDMLCYFAAYVMFLLLLLLYFKDLCCSSPVKDREDTPEDMHDQYAKL